MQSTQLRPCDVNDLDEVLHIAKSTFIETFGHLNDPTHFDAYVEKAFAKDNVAKELTTEGSRFYLLSLDGEAAGYLKLNLAPAQSDVNDPESLEIERIYVYSKYHGLGLGKLLFEKAMTVAKETSVKYIWLGVWEKNDKALRFYKARGFYKFAEHPFKLGNDLQTDDLMRMDL